MKAKIIIKIKNTYIILIAFFDYNTINKDGCHLLS